MEVELQRAILPQFRTEIPHSIKQSNTHVVCLRLPSAFGERVPNPTSRVKSLEVHCNNGQKLQKPAVSSIANLRLPGLSFDRLQPTDQECEGLETHHFSRYIAREAVLDEEYWTAAWLRAEAHWESVSYMRNIDAYKRKYAEQEFYALKGRCSGLDGNSLKCFCLVAVKREEKNVRRTVLNSVVGTLDLSIRQFFPGETYPGNKRSSSLLCQAFRTRQYAYVANVCVSKFARRQGIASNLLHLATNMAIASGMKQLYVHVNANNNGAQGLYSKAGFKFVEGASSATSKDQRLLMLKVL